MKHTKTAAALFSAAVMLFCTACGSGDTSSAAAKDAAAYSAQFKDKIVDFPPDGYDSKQEGVSYPGWKKYTYYSNTAGRDTDLYVMLPEGYSEDKKYPVLYLLHGFFGNSKSMTESVWNVSEILTNLQKSGDAKEMIVVSPYLYCSKDEPVAKKMDPKTCLGYDNFVNDLTADIMPFIEKNFSIAAGRENTAITGFSMGGRESLFIGITHPELFGYVGAACPAPGIVETQDKYMKHPGQLKPEQMKFDGDKPYVLFISSSNSDPVVTTAPESYRKIFTDNGVEYLQHVLEKTGHDQTTVKPHLYNYFRMLFK